VGIRHAANINEKESIKSTLQRTAAHCNALQHTAAHCSTLQHTAAHCSTLQHAAARCSTLQHTAAHCSTLQHTAAQKRGSSLFPGEALKTPTIHKRPFIEVIRIAFESVHHVTHILEPHLRERGGGGGGGCWGSGLCTAISLTPTP